MNPFLLPAEEYQRDIDVHKGYIQQTAKHLSLTMNKPYQDCLKFVVEKMGKGQAHGLRDPEMERLTKKRPGERVLEETTFLGYIDDVISSGRILSPSMVVYERPEVERSVTAEWLDDNIKARKTAKTRMFVLKQQGDILGAQLADYDQNARKIRINSVSGQRGFPGNPLFLATGHSSLTSLCRAAAGYGNATVERFLMGSRHFHTPEIARANLLSVITIEKLDRLQPVIDKYGLVYPTVDDVMDLVLRGSEFYWRDQKIKGSDETHMESIRRLVNGMSDLERAAICYSGDMYHLAKLNPEVVHKLISELTVLELQDPGSIDADAYIKALDSTEKAYIHSLCADIMKGKTPDKVRDKEPENWKIIGQCAKQFKEALSKYSDLINALFATKHLPPTVANLKSIQRRASLAADTDSAIFTTEYWVEWYCGELKRGVVEDRVWYLMTYMTCQCIAHSLAMLSANVGVERSQLFRLAMKNEYAFPVFALTNLAKHYYSYMTIREGNVYKKPDLEIKGVELRGSTSTKTVLQAAEDLMCEVLDAANSGKKLNAEVILNRIAEFELETVRSIMRGEYTYLKSASVKPDTKNMVYDELWNDVFAPKYGKSVAPPYPCVKVSTQLLNKTLLRTWLAEIEDRELAKRMTAWLDKYNRKDLKTILLPTAAISSGGLPIEIQEAANVRKLAYQINSGFYRILESTGLFLVDRNNYRLVYDFLGLKP